MSASDETRGAEVVALARSWIGTPFRHRASVRGAGADCLGLVRGLWRALHGPEPRALPPYDPLPDDARAEPLWDALAALLAPAPEAGGPGCVLVFRLQRAAPARHLGIQTGCGASAGFVHAYGRHGVLESPLAGPWVRMVVARFWLAPRGSGNAAGVGGGVAPVGVTADSPRIFLHR